jgi:hypothetical protein
MSMLINLEEKVSDWYTSNITEKILSIKLNTAIDNASLKTSQQTCERSPVVEERSPYRKPQKSGVDA